MWTAPSTAYEAITPSDSVDLSNVARGLYVGGDGNVVVVSKGAAAITFTGVKAGTVLPLQFIRINSTSTTATGLVALY